MVDGRSLFSTLKRRRVANPTKKTEEKYGGFKAAARVLLLA